MTKKIVIFGDSISCGKFTGSDDDCPKSYVDKKWFQVAFDSQKYDIINYSVSGVSISSTSSVLSEEAICKKYGKMDNEADYVIIAGGTNDFGTNVVLGDESDTEDISFCGALTVLFSGLKLKYPFSKLYMLLPIGRKDELSNKIGNSLDDYCKKITAIGKKYNVNIIDSAQYGFDSHNHFIQDKVMRDGVHIDQHGHILLGKSVHLALQDELI